MIGLAAYSSVTARQVPATDDSIAFSWGNYGCR